jgi:hypothetical protein
MPKSSKTRAVVVRVAGRGHGIGCGGTNRGRGDADVAVPAQARRARRQDLQADGFNVMINWLEVIASHCRNANQGDP